MSEDTTTQTSVTQEGLSISDLKLCIQIIDLCSSRGAFKPEEFQAIGHIHNKLTRFIQLASPAETSVAGKDMPQTQE